MKKNGTGLGTEFVEEKILYQIGQVSILLCDQATLDHLTDSAEIIMPHPVHTLKTQELNTPKSFAIRKAAEARQNWDITRSTKEKKEQAYHAPAA